MGKSDIERMVEDKLIGSLDKYFKIDQEGKRFVNVSRVPLICQSIKGIDKSLIEINTKLDTHIDDINRRLDDKYVTKDTFSPVQKLVYGFVAIVLSGIILAILALVINK